MYKLEFTLKQHTPIIHFQHDQDGATLRATEVKPKLDRFILTKLGEDALKNPNATSEEKYQEGYKISKEKGWLVGSGNHPALDYKFIVKKSNNEITSFRLEFIENDRERDPKKKWIVKRKHNNTAMILANMAGKPSSSELKDLRMFESIDCEIYSFNSLISDAINNRIIEFFATTNFGNRNNKGYGSFSIILLNKIEIKWDENILIKGTFFLEMPSNNLKQIFDVIDFFYKWMKSGINYSYDRNNQRNPCNSSRYKKAILFEYLESLYPSTTIGNNWEKRWIKENYLSLTSKTPPDYIAKYYRALLGLSDKNTFTKAQCSRNPEFVSTFQENMINKLDLQNLHSDHNIDRISSPLTFKIIIQGNICKAYILIKDDHIDSIYLNGLGKNFTFFYENELRINYRIGGGTFDIDFKYPNNDISELDTHLNRIRPHISISALNEKYERIKEFKEQFNTIELPNSKINYSNLLSYFKKKYPKFRGKDFRWTDIIPNKDIEIKTL